MKRWNVEKAGSGVDIVEADRLEIDAGVLLFYGPPNAEIVLPLIVAYSRRRWLTVRPVVTNDRTTSIPIGAQIHDDTHDDDEDQR